MRITRAHYFPQSVSSRNCADGSQTNEAVSYFVCTSYIMKSNPPINGPTSRAVNTDEDVSTEESPSQ